MLVAVIKSPLSKETGGIPCSLCCLKAVRYLRYLRSLSLRLAVLKALDWFGVGGVTPVVFKFLVSDVSFVFRLRDLKPQVRSGLVRA